ncbi:unnamed protein product [Chrysoparadoxa australica]
MEGLRIRDDTAWSACAGLALGLLLIAFLLRYPGEPFDYSRPDGKTKVEDASSEPDSEPRGHEPEGLRRRGNAGKEDEVIAPKVTAGMVEWSNEEKFNPHNIDEGELAARLRRSKAIRLLGLSEDQLQQAVRDAKEELVAEKEGRPFQRRKAENLSSGGSLTKKVDFAVYTLLFAGLFYFMNRDYKGAATKILQQFFPREMSTLGFGTSQTS